MHLEIKKRKILFSILFGICVLYSLLRIFITQYVSAYSKYVFLFIVIIGIFISITSKKHLSEVGSSEWFLLIVSYLYILTNALAFGGKELFSLSITAYVLYTFPIIVFPYLAKKVQWNKLVMFLSYFGLIDAVLAIFEYITGKQIFSMSDFEAIEMVTKAGALIRRTYGLQGSFFILAQVLCFCGFAAFYLFRFQHSKIHLASFVVITIGILTTGSRGFYVSYAFGLIIMYLCEPVFDKSRKKISLSKLAFGFVVILFVIILIFIVFHSDIKTGNDNIDIILNRIRMVIDWQNDSANLKRVRIWEWAINYWKESPIFGNGACCTDLRYSGYINVTESGFLKRLVELGIIGTIVQYVTMVIPLKKGIKKLRRKKVNANPRILIFIATVAGYLLEDMVLERYTSPEYTIVLWFSISYIAYYDLIDKNNYVSGKPLIQVNTTNTTGVSNEG